MKLYIDNNDHECELKEINIIVQDANNKEIESLNKKIDVSEFDEEMYCFARYDKTNEDMERKIIDMISKHTSSFILYGSTRIIKVPENDSETLVTEFSIPVTNENDPYDIFISYVADDFDLMVEMYHFCNGRNCMSVTEFKAGSKVLNLINSEIEKTRKEIETVFNY